MICSHSLNCYHILPPMEPRNFNIKGDLLCFFIIFPFPLMCFIGSYPCKRSSNLKKSVPTGAPLCSWSAWNASSVVPPLILWLLDITTSHVCIIYVYFHSRREENWTLKTQHSQLKSRWPVLAQVCVTWPIRAEEGGLKETRAGTECLFAMDSMRKLM